MSISWSESESGLFGNPELSKKSRFIATKMMKMYEAVTPADDFFLGKKSGDTIAFRLWGRIPGTAETPLSEFQKVPMVTPPSYEASAIVYRRGVAVPFTKLREDLDRLTTEDVVIHSLQEHSGRTHNKVIYDAAVAGRSFTYVPTSASAATFLATGSVAATAAANYSAFHARGVKLKLTQYNVPFADGENYQAIISPIMYDNILGDVGVNGWVDVKKYASGGADGILNGEVGSYLNVRYAVDNDVLPDGIGSGSAYGSGFFFGYDAIREVPVYPMELLANMNLGGDFGQQKAIAWLSCLTYKTVWVYSTHGQGTVLHYTSA